MQIWLFVYFWQKLFIFVTNKMKNESKENMEEKEHEDEGGEKWSCEPEPFIRVKSHSHFEASFTLITNFEKFLFYWKLDCIFQKVDIWL